MFQGGAFGHLSWTVPTHWGLCIWGCSEVLQSIPPSTLGYHLPPLSPHHTDSLAIHTAYPIQECSTACVLCREITSRPFFAWQGVKTKGRWEDPELPFLWAVSSARLQGPTLSLWSQPDRCTVMQPEVPPSCQQLEHQLFPNTVSAHSKKRLSRG